MNDQATVDQPERLRLEGLTGFYMKRDTVYTLQTTFNPLIEAEKLGWAGTRTTRCFEGRVGTHQRIWP